MKGGIAASIVAMAALAQQRAHWSGEAVLALAGDEETMGPLGTKLLLESVPHATGEATIIGDAGSPMVALCGEKGFVGIDIAAEGKAAHGSFMHLGVYEIDRVRRCPASWCARCAMLPVAMPDQVRSAIAAAKSISEPLCGLGEADVLTAVTVNIGIVSGGTSPNLVPPATHASVDIRLPVAVAAETLLVILRQGLDLPGITWRVLRCFEPKSHQIPTMKSSFVAVPAARPKSWGRLPAVNMRVGGSEARAGSGWRAFPLSFTGRRHTTWARRMNMQRFRNWASVSRVHALTAFDLLTNWGVSGA